MSNRTAGPDAPARLQLVVPADELQLAPLRRNVVEHLRAGGADGELVADLELVVSELATNVIQHTQSDTITVVVGVADGVWTLDVFDAEEMPDPARRSRVLPAADVPTGRGLIIAAALSDTIELVRLGDRVAVRCTRGT